MVGRETNKSAVECAKLWSKSPVDLGYVGITNIIEESRVVEL